MNDALLVSVLKEVFSRCNSNSRCTGKCTKVFGVGVGVGVGVGFGLWLCMLAVLVVLVVALSLRFGGGGGFIDVLSSARGNTSMVHFSTRSLRVLK